MKKLVSSSSKSDRATGETIVMSTHRVRPINKTFHLGTQATGVRDAILRVLEREFASESFMPGLANHFKLIGADKLDSYSEIEIGLPNHSARLVFQTWREEPDEMTYTLPDLTLDPDVRLQDPEAKRAAGFFSFPWFRST